jgi:four helix bundle protein
VVFDFEKMDVYRQSLEVLDLAVAVADLVPRGQRPLADQIKRAASSISLNTAEGIGEFKPAEKARFYRMALRSASETTAILQITLRLKFTTESKYHELYEALTRVSKMLTKLIASMHSRAHIRDGDRCAKKYVEKGAGVMQRAPP